MKRCPNCAQVFNDDTNFCLNDGTPLILDYGQPESATPSLVDEIPTRYIARPPVAISHSPKWVYPLVGILCGLVVVLGFFAFFRAPLADKPDITQKNEASESNRNTEMRRTPQAAPTPAQMPSPSPVKQTENTVVAVNSPRDGYLALKSEACVAPCGTTLVKIPHRTRLTLGTCKYSIEVADRRPGRWCYTSYGGYNGWVFDAFVTR